MPRRKHWRKSDSKRRERSRTDESETTVTGKYTGSPEQLLRQGSPGGNQAGSPGRNQAVSPEGNQAGSPGRNQAGSPGRNQAGSPERMPAKSPEKKQADLEKPVHSNKSDKLVQKEKVHSKNEEFQCSDFFKSLTASDSSNSQTSFDAVVMDTFPDVVANYQSRDKELSERERIAFCPVNTSQQNEELKRNVTAQHQLSSDPLEVCSDNDVACYQAIRSSELLWNASDLVFGSFHQNDGRFSEHSRGYQCTCNALCMLSYAHCGDVDNCMVLDKVLYEGDALYQAVIRKLKSDGKFSQHLLSLEEIPDDFEVEIGKFTLEKFHIESGPLIDTQDLGLPTLHEVLQSAILSVSSGLLTVGAICSAVFKKKGAYAFFDSHCHGHNGLSATDGTSSLITFSSLDDLVRYMFAFYDSMKIDTSMQYDFLPINVKKSQNKQSYKDEMASHIEAYFNDQRLRQAYKSHTEVRSISNDLSSIAIEKSNKALWGKRKEFKDRSEYFKRKCRPDSAFKGKERDSKQSARKDPVFKAKERESKQSARKDSVYKAKERESKQSVRKDPVFKVKERESKQSARQNPVFRAKASMYQKESKQSARKDPVFKAKERESKQSARQNPVLGPKNVCIRKNQSNLQEKILSLKQKKENQSNLPEKNPVFRAKESMHQKESKQSARKDPVFKTEERESKQFARRNPYFRAKETVYQKESKRKARENPYFLECERIKKQQIRQEKRKFNDDSGIDVPRKRSKPDTDPLPKSHQKDLTIEESIKRFHSDIAIGPLYVCSCCHQTWFRKSVSMLKNTHISAESKRLHCTDFTSVGNEEWICHTCLSALRENKPLKLSVANGMKWRDKPPELNLHQLEERLIALRIPFMQIRELPRGGQYSLKGNVIYLTFVDLLPILLSCMNCFILLC